MIDQQELQLTDHPPAPWCRPANVVELREAFARRERGEVCDCGECPEGSPDIFPLATKLRFRVVGNQPFVDGVRWSCADIFRLTGWTWEMDMCDATGLWFRLRRK